MDYRAGDLVIMTHPHFDRHVVAEIESVTKVMCEVYYWTPKGRGDTKNRRRLDGITGLLTKGMNPVEAATRLHEIDAARTIAQQAAEAAYKAELRKVL